MGITYIEVKVKNLTDESKEAREKFLVDTGAHYTLVPQNIARKLGLKPNRSQEFILANGKTVKRKMGSAIIEVNGYSEPSTVILGEKGDSALLGTITLEQMGLMVNPFKRTLERLKPLLV